MTEGCFEADSKNGRAPCPYCGSNLISKNGTTHHKKPKFLCQVCRRQFIDKPQKKYRSQQEIF
ncbi:MAG: hypothetical protein N5P05_000004 [Chroococcopsis gigantea SAG 12.99]|jgi:insertion element IS1 protein InsB|nr:hypothetical protein [Chroococcopsis gigantea SAG 12.99]